MEIYKVDGRQIHAGRSWVAADGTRHPKTWTRWSDEEKEAAGISTVVLQPFPDQRLYASSHNDDGSVASTPRALDGEHGVKAALIAEVKQQQASLLAGTDWAIVRKADNGTAIPAAIQSWRDALRSKATEMETAIANAANTDAVAALFLSWDVDGNKSGILYDWPEIDD
jgi:hypothetical protein